MGYQQPQPPTWQPQPGGAAAVPYLRPLDVGQKIDAAIKLVTRNFGTLARIVLIVAAPVQLLAFVVTASTVPDDYTVGSNFGGGGATPESDVDASSGFWVGQGVVALLGILVYVLTTAACFRAIGQAYLGERPDWRASLGYAAKRIHSVLWIFFLAGLAVLVGFICLIIPGIYLWNAFYLVMPILLLERLKGASALGRAVRLIRNHWWRTFGVLIAGNILAQVISSIVQGLLAALMFVAVGDDSVVALALSGIAGLAGQLITTPFIAALITVVYFDLRVRKEAFDLQLLAQAMSGGSAEAAVVAEPGGAHPPAQTYGAPVQWGPPGQWQQPGTPPGGWPQPQPGAWGQQPPTQPGQPAPPPGWGPPAQPGQPPAGWGSPGQPVQEGPPQSPPGQAPPEPWQPPPPPSTPPEPPPGGWAPPAHSSEGQGEPDEDEPPPGPPPAGTN